jgi:hypothetical protein
MPETTPVFAPTAAPAAAWFQSPLGALLERQEAGVLLPALEGAVGLHALQVGAWGARGDWLAACRAQRRTLLAAAGTHIGPHVVAELDQWPVQSDMVDTVLLPHTLDFAADPHAIVREAVRVLVGEGQLMVLGFAPLGTWYQAGRLRREPLPTQGARPIGAGQLRDWLRVLGCETVAVGPCLSGLPSARVMGGRLETLLANAGPRYWPWACGAYLLQARKQVPSMTAIRLRWQRRPSLMRGSEMAKDSRQQAASHNTTPHVGGSLPSTGIFVGGSLLPTLPAGTHISSCGRELAPDSSTPGTFE